MQYKLVVIDDQGTERSFPIETIQIIPRGVDLLITVPMETMDSDFYMIQEEVQEHLGREGRTIVVARMGDIAISGIARKEL